MSTLNSVFEKLRLLNEDAIPAECGSYIPLDPDDLICESNLWECKKFAEPELRHCILTKNLLICCPFTQNESKVSLKSPKNIPIPIKWLPMQKICTETTFGFILKISPSSTLKFIFIEKEDISIWYDNLSKLCIQENINTEFTILSKIGLGGTALVQSAINNFTNRHVALKCFAKANMMKRPNIFVFFLIRNAIHRLI